MKCKQHITVDLECIAGCSAHQDNWYCPKCDIECGPEYEDGPWAYGWEERSKIGPTVTGEEYDI